ncbi:pantetheine-phosphate adenylyltransferase [Candidatus Coxiella mudrowiae]|uniref:Phosphopantetheine adenylyltransferase n=1 Tax=Candidatus Coxiella mudrowiae TaxID=2054173 RepID=A0ABN4HSJ9_9COXI|nr:pantetheine-phosphate adenylyltransferase [Candidatus Coxiella mudrowiae]AKQ33879.1 Phosphopantetheine adenylyltransferase [Candidatus Coxiella mudrowiae]
MKPVAVYPGTFDPLTKGHVDIVERAMFLFEKIIVACAPTSRKTPHLSLAERIDLIKGVFFSDEINIEVAPLEGLLVDFAKQHNAKIILRGLRAVSDFDYEFQLAYMNHHLSPEIQTVFLLAKESYSHISGTLVREIVKLGGDISPFVPPLVAQRLAKRKKI